MLENKEERAKNKAVQRRTAGEQKNGTDNIAIPDYVMRDFGSPEEQGHIEESHEILERAHEHID